MAALVTGIIWLVRRTVNASMAFCAARHARQRRHACLLLDVSQQKRERQHGGLRSAARAQFAQPQSVRR
jgi:hypothetical protein